MSAQDNLSSMQFYYTPPKGKQGVHGILAVTGQTERKAPYTGVPSATPEDSKNENIVGRISWHPRTGVVQWVQTEKEHRRKGVATALWKKANDLSEKTGIKAPQHSAHRWNEGDAWAKSVGGRLPQKRSVT
jgi:GNAT superfamily N-acetyltransferase